MTHRLNSASKLHGLDHFEYVGTLREQGGACKICHRPPKPGEVLAWDHDHQHCPGKHGCPKCVRGLLCVTCNTRVYLIESTLPWISGILAYLGAWASGQNRH